MTQALRWSRFPATALAERPDLAARWTLLNAARLNLPFLDADVVNLALRCFGQGQEQLLVARRNGEPVAMLIMVRLGHGRWQTFQPSQLPLGCWVSQAGLDVTQLCRELTRGPLGPCLTVGLTQVDPLMAPRGSGETDCSWDDYIATAWLDIAGSFDEYWAQRGKNLRQNLRKQRNRLAADSIEARMLAWQEPADVRAAVGRYAALESAGWKAQGNTAIGTGNTQGRFYTELFDAAARRGEARVFEYRFGESTVACNLALLRAGILVVLKTTYDESQPKHLSPASLLREEELQLFFAGTEVRRIEYYGKLMDWHTKLTEQSRVLYHLGVYRWAWLRDLAVRRRRAALASATEPLADGADQSEGKSRVGSN
jgi:hypothetical protein